MRVGIERAWSVLHRWLQDHHCSDVQVIYYHQKTGNNKLCNSETLALFRWLVERQAILTDADLTFFFQMMYILPDVLPESALLALFL